MIITDNEFQLINIRTELNNILLTIKLKADDKTRDVYLNNYYEGLYIGSESAKYNIYAKIKENLIEGEVLFDTIREYASKQPVTIQRLWVRCRVGNTYIDHAVTICIGETNIAFSHMESYIISRQNAQQLCICSQRNMPMMKNPFKNDRSLKVFGLAMTENGVIISVTVIGGIVGDLCLAWRGMKNNKIYYFHVESIVDDFIEYALSKDEISQLGKLEKNDMFFEWIMVDREDNQYKLYLDDEIEIVENIVNVDDCCVQLYKDNDGFCTYMRTSFFFNYLGSAYDGHGLRLEFPKRSYELELLSFVAQRVNTDIEYVLPFEVFSEDKSKIIYDIMLEFGVGEDENSFREGIYQFFVELRDGFLTERYPLKLFRFHPIKENTYLIVCSPYSVIGGHYYNCLFYNDSSNNLKCNVVPKRMKLQLSKAELGEGDVNIPYRIKKEPYFDSVSEMRLVKGNGDFIVINFDDQSVDDKPLEIAGYMTILLEQLYKSETNVIYRIEICFDGREESILVENNFFRPAVTNRELCSFSFLNKFSDNVYRRVWGNHINGSYMFGVTENAEFFSLNGMWLYEDDKLCIRIEWLEDKGVEHYKDKEIELFLRDVITGNQIKFDREWTVEGEIIFRVPLSAVTNKEFLIVGVLPDGIVSYIKNASATYTLFSNTTSKKIIMRKVCDNLYINVEEVLICENAERATECQQIITRARNENKGENGKIWLLGENYGLSARDNGLAFFEYCMQNMDAIDAEVYFVTKSDHQDMGALEQYRNHVLIYDSNEHIYYDELAEFYIVSHGIRDVMPSLYHNMMDRYRKNVIYLQHGIAAMKMFGINNNTYGGSIRKFVVSSEQERALLVDNKQFWEDEIVVTGLARYDKLFCDYQQEGKYIWIMPTWRDWLVKSEREFINSDFYSYYSKILSNTMLIETLRKSRQMLVFSLHIEFEKYKSFFDKFESDVVHITDMHERSISERIKECSMAVTDYSSLVFDVVYLGKPVIFFQYDQEMYNRYRGSYVNLETDLPGKVTYEPESMAKALIKEINNGFVVDEKYVKCAKRYFDFRDSNNSERIYQAIIECRKEIADEY